VEVRDAGVSRHTWRPGTRPKSSGESQVVTLVFVSAGRSAIASTATSVRSRALLFAPWNRRLAHPERVGPTVVRCRRPRRRYGVMHRRNSSKVRDERTNIFLIPVRRMIPNHPLPMQGAAIRRNAASNCACDGGITPASDAGLAIGRDVSRPQRAEGTPAELRATTPVRVVAERARRHLEEVLAALRQGTFFRRQARRIGCRITGGCALNDLFGWDHREGRQLVHGPDHDSSREHRARGGDCSNPACCRTWPPLLPNRDDEEAGRPKREDQPLDINQQSLRPLRDARGSREVAFSIGEDRRIGDGQSASNL